MSNLRQPNGDDHPAAAGKHLIDAQTLLKQRRADGAAYLSGYVVECALKTLLLYGHGWQPGQAVPWKRRDGHQLGVLQGAATTLATLAGGSTARYLRTATSAVATSPIATWNPEIRYRAEVFPLADAREWCEIAGRVYAETVEEIQKDGVL